MTNDEHLDNLEALRKILSDGIRDHAPENTAIVSIIGTLEVLKDEFMQIIRDSK